VRRSANEPLVHTLAIVVISRPEERCQFSNHGHRHSTRRFLRDYLVRILSAFDPFSSCCVLLDSRLSHNSLVSPTGYLLFSLTLDLVALPPSPTSPTPEQVPSTAPMLSMASVPLAICPCPPEQRICQVSLMCSSSILSSLPPTITRIRLYLNALLHHRLRPLSRPAHSIQKGASAPPCRVRRPDPLSAYASRCG
jgi:hypothetical protein